jgi:hypothetical protein
MTTTSKAIPYEEHEVKGGSLTKNNPSPPEAATSTAGNENVDTNEDADAGTGTGNTSSSFAHLALVPLHPACKKQNLESKQLPIVLGRTNLASWWWKSCPCQHYCRLHCRPVAQNIRSLSKVMIQLDTAGRVHIAGKNPHLVTITPERNDQPLQVNDILSIGRRDREPWMRFQVVPKSDNEPPVSQSKAKTYTPEWMAKQNKIKSSEHANGRNDKSETPAPPEWITTTRKRKSSRSSSCTYTKQQQQQQQQQRPVVSNLLEAAAAAGDNYPINNPNSSNNNNNNDNLEGSDTNFPHRKRRRRDSAEKKARNRNATEPAASAATEKEHHLQVHLLFQDYETSANLVKATQRKKKSCNPSSSSNKEETPRTFVADKSQVQLLSISFASALLGQAKPSSQLSADAHSAPNPNNGQQQPQQQSSSPSAESAPEAMTQPEGAQESANNLGVQPESQQNVEAQYQDRQDDQPEMEDAPQSNSEPRPLESSDQQQQQQHHLESSMLTMPQCASESFQEPETMEPALAKPKENSNDNGNGSSEASPPSCDPITDLGPWRQIVAREKGNFRHALASLIVCKNEARQQDTNGGLLWLPSLLEDDFYMEPPVNGNKTGEL